MTSFCTWCDNIHDFVLGILCHPVVDLLSGCCFVQEVHGPARGTEILLEGFGVSWLDCKSLLYENLVCNQQLDRIL